MCNGHSDIDYTHYSFRPYSPSKLLISFFIIGCILVFGISFSGIKYGITFQRRDTLVFSILLSFVGIAALVIIGILVSKSMYKIIVSNFGLCIYHGKKTAIPFVPWRNFYKAYFLHDYRGNTYLVLSEEELLVGTQKQLMIELADNIPKVKTYQYITLRLEHDTAEIIEHLINGVIPIEKQLEW